MRCCAIIMSFLMLGGVLSAQSADEDKVRTAVCSFDDGKQMSVRYNAVIKENPPNGRPWMPGGAAMTLFTETETALGGRSIPTGGYTMYLVTGKKEWTLIARSNEPTTNAESSSVSGTTRAGGTQPRWRR